jgi:molecular chaperone DnaK
METEVNLPYVTADASGPKHLVMKLNRTTFEQLSEDLVERIRGPFEAALKDAGVKAADLDEVVLVGGATRMPMVQELVEKMSAKSPHKGVNPDEVVSIGAAIQAGVLGGDVKDVLLLDVTPLTLGIETLGAVMTPMIERNTTIPVRKNEVFSTADDNQTAVDIHILQGERTMANDNMSLGRFRLEGIPPAPRGIPQVEVTFDIDANGILNVTAKDKATGKEQKITITASTNLDDSDIDRMVQEAKTNKAEDEKRRELITAKNNADSLAYQTEKTLKELGDKVPSDDKTNIEAQIKSLREAAQGEDLNKIEQQTETLQNAFHALSQQLYAQEGQQQQAAGAPGADFPNYGGQGAPGGNGSSDEGDKDDEGEVLEGEFTEN